MLSSITKPFRVGASSPLALPFALYISMSFATQLLEVPTVRLFESAICNRYYRTLGDSTIFDSSGVDERSCKTAPVQNLLANIVGWKMSFDAIPGLLMAIYYGSMAKKFGPRHILLLSSAGSLLMLVWIVAICSFDTVFPVQVAWVSSIFLFIGGGTRVYNSMIFTLVSDCLGTSQRTTYLYLLAAGPHVNRLITPRIATVLMGTTIFTPFWVSFSILGACMLLIFFVNEPTKAKDKHYYVSIEDPDSSLAAQDYTTDEPSDVEESPASKLSAFNKWTELTRIIHDIGIVFRGSASKFCLAAFFLKRVAFTSEGFMFQYASEKFLWELRQTTWLRVAAASGAVFVTLFACPLLTYLLVRKGFKTHHLDLNVIRVSSLVVVLAFLGAWRAPSVILLAFAMVGCGFGEGIEPALQGLVTFVTDSGQNARVFTTVAVCDTIAELTGGPVTARLMEIGRRPGHPSDGICFLASSILFGVLGMLACMITINDEE